MQLSEMGNWATAFERYVESDERKKKYSGELLTFGNEFLDQAMRGIFPDDLVLVGAPSGVGKTQFSTNLALKNVMNGKRVHFFALEASVGEIEDRLRYSLFAKMFYADTSRETGVILNFTDWILGKFDKFEEKYRAQVTEQFEKLTGLWTFYKDSEFRIEGLIENIMLVASNTDLIIIDHAHYFDLDDQNENRALKEIAKTIRSTSQIVEKPVVLIAHLRKRDKISKDFMPGIDDFHGSSDLTKIATKVILISKGGMTGSTRSETYFRIVKCRLDGSLTNYIGKSLYNFKTGDFDQQCWVGRLSYDEKGKQFFDGISREEDRPYWFKGRLCTSE